MDQVKILQVKVEKPLSDIEKQVDDFIDAKVKAGSDVVVQAVSYFENTFQRVHGLIVHYISTPNGNQPPVPAVPGEPAPVVAQPGEWDWQNKKKKKNKK